MTPSSSHPSSGRGGALNTNYFYNDDTVRDFSIFYNCRSYNWAMRYTLFVIQLIFITFTISIACVIFYFRNNKV
jgi:hypothetical protein